MEKGGGDAQQQQKHTHTNARARQGQRAWFFSFATRFISNKHKMIMLNEKPIQIPLHPSSIHAHTWSKSYSLPLICAICVNTIVCCHCSGDPCNKPARTAKSVCGQSPGTQGLAQVLCNKAHPTATAEHKTVPRIEQLKLPLPRSRAGKDSARESMNTFCRPECRDRNSFTYHLRPAHASHTQERCGVCEARQCGKVFSQLCSLVCTPGKESLFPSPTANIARSRTPLK